jgi:hypothetical protein
VALEPVVAAMTRRASEKLFARYPIQSALCKLRDEIAEEVKNRAESLNREIDQLIGPTSSRHWGRSFSNVARRVPPGMKNAPAYTGTRVLGE